MRCWTPRGSLPRAATAELAAISSRANGYCTLAEAIEHEHTTVGRRIRSAVLLVLLIGVLGALTAATLGVLVVTLTSLVDQALG